MKITLPRNQLRLHDICKLSCLDSNYAIILSEDNIFPECSVYTIKPLRLSKWRLIRKIQILVIKKAFN